MNTDEVIDLDTQDGDLMEELVQDDDFYETPSLNSESGTETVSWITWFCSLTGHEFYTEISEDFIEDDFNLTGLNSLVPYYNEALEIILDIEQDEEELKGADIPLIEASAELLYGLIHQRFIITRQGLEQMVEKYEAGQFGYCPRYFCENTLLIPCGTSDTPSLDTVKLFCPNCLDLYNPPSRYQIIDGAFFGTTFPHLFFQTFSDLVPDVKPDVYTPKLFGFKISEFSRVGPRMKWLRARQVEDSSDSESEIRGQNGVDKSVDTNPLNSEKMDIVTSPNNIPHTNDDTSHNIIDHYVVPNFKPPRNLYDYPLHSYYAKEKFVS